MACIVHVYLTIDKRYSIYPLLRFRRKQATSSHGYVGHVGKLDFTAACSQGFELAQGASRILFQLARK